MMAINDKLTLSFISPSTIGLRPLTPSRGIKMSSAIPLSWTIQEILMFLLSLLPHLGVSNVGRNELKQRLMGSNPSQFVDVVPCTY